MGIRIRSDYMTDDDLIFTIAAVAGLFCAGLILIAGFL